MEGAPSFEPLLAFIIKEETLPFLVAFAEQRLPVAEAAAVLNAGTLPLQDLSAGKTTNEVVCAANKHTTSVAGRKNAIVLLLREKRFDQLQKKNFDQVKHGARLAQHGKQAYAHSE